MYLPHPGRRQKPVRPARGRLRYRALHPRERSFLLIGREDPARAGGATRQSPGDAFSPRADRGESLSAGRSRRRTPRHRLSPRPAMVPPVPNPPRMRRALPPPSSSCRDHPFRSPLPPGAAPRTSGSGRARPTVRTASGRHSPARSARGNPTTASRPCRDRACHRDGRDRTCASPPVR